MTPRCSAGCGAAATHVLEIADGKPPVYFCETGARDSAADVRRLTHKDLGLPAPRPDGDLPSSRRGGRRRIESPVQANVPGGPRTVAHPLGSRSA